MISKDDLYKLVQQYEQATPADEIDCFANLVNAAIQVNIRFATWEIGSQQDMDHFVKTCELYGQGQGYSDAMRSAIYGKHE